MAQKQPVNLSLSNRLDFAGRPVPAGFTNTYGGTQCSKYSAKTAADWMFTKRGFMPVSASRMRTAAPITRKRAFLTFQKDSGNLPTGLHVIPAQKCIESAGKYWIPVFNVNVH